ncbi:MAG: hypothetical protein WDW38_002073 [Sanguina aurantia]
MLISSKSRSLRHLSDSHWAAKTRLAPADSKQKTVELVLPTQRSGDVLRSITLPAETTARQFFTAVHGFYDTPITAEDLRGHDVGWDMFDYIKSAREGIAAGKRVTWADLMGST